MRAFLILLAVSFVAVGEAHASCPDRDGSFAECRHLVRSDMAADTEHGPTVESGRDEAGEKTSVLFGHGRDANAATASTQEAVVEDGSTGHGLGLAAGLTTGVGVAYRRFITPAHGVHIGGIAFGDTNSFRANLGVEYLRMIHRRGASRLYWTLGGSVFYHRYETTIFPGCEPVPPRPGPGQCDFSNPVQGWRNQRTYSLGPGIGLEWNPGPMGISLELPLALRFRDDQEGFRYDSFLPIPNVSIVYYLPK